MDRVSTVAHVPRPAQHLAVLVRLASLVVPAHLLPIPASVLRAVMELHARVHQERPSLALALLTILARSAHLLSTHVPVHRASMEVPVLGTVPLTLTATVWTTTTMETLVPHTKTHVSQRRVNMELLVSGSRLSPSLASVPLHMWEPTAN